MDSETATSGEVVATDEEREIPFPKGFGIKKLFYGVHSGSESRGQINREEVLAVYESGNILIVFENGKGRFDVGNRGASFKKLKEAEVLADRLVKVHRSIQGLEDVSSISKDLKNSLTEVAELFADPDSPVEDLGDRTISDAGDVLDSLCGQLEGNTALNLVLGQKMVAVFKQLEALGVESVSYGGLQLMNGHIGVSTAQ